MEMYKASALIRRDLISFGSTLRELDSEPVTSFGIRSPIWFPFGHLLDVIKS